ncbi:MAG TPA: DUF192 domain-containing protein [Candidatus Gracilibacteria bacterium]
MKKLSLVLGTLLLGFSLGGCQKPPQVIPPPNVHIGAQSWVVDIVGTPEERSRGLMGRESLDPSEGMVFVFEAPGKHGFWMKNTLVPLDIIWISENFEVVAIRHNTPPCEKEKSEKDLCIMYIPQTEALYALEIKAKTFNGSVGDPVEFSWIKDQ